MAAPDNKDGSNSIALLLVGVVSLAIIIITLLTITAILNGPPAL